MDGDNSNVIEIFPWIQMACKQRLVFIQMKSSQAGIVLSLTLNDRVRFAGKCAS